MKKVISGILLCMLVFISACEGPKGPAGEPGTAGTAGDKGDKGDTGDPGAPANPSAVVLSTSPRYDSATDTTVLSWTINVDGNFTQYKLYRSSPLG